MSWFVWSKKKPKQPAPKAATAGDGDRRAQLSQLIRLVRKRINPRLLKLGEDVVTGKVETVDQENARKAIEMFLAGRQDNGAYRQKLLAYMKRQSGTH